MPSIDPSECFPRSGWMQLVLPQPRGMLALLMGPGMAGTHRAWLGPRHSALMPTEGEESARAVWGRLIEAVATRRDRAAFVALFEHFAPRVKTFALRSGVSAATAEELAQETMLTVWRKADSFVPGSAGAAAWIFTIARNLRIDALRRERRNGCEVDIDWETVIEFSCRWATDAGIAGRSGPVGTLRPQGDGAAVERAVARDRTVLLRGEGAGVIAEQLQIPLGTVKSRSRLAITRLRSLLGEMS